MLRIRQAVLTTLAMLALGCAGKQDHKPSGSEPGVSGAGGSFGADPRSTEAASIWAGAGGTSANGGAGSADGVGGDVDSRELEVSEFQSTNCTTHAVHGNLTDLPALFTGREPTEYFGLQCVAWDATRSDRFVLDLVGFMESSEGHDAVSTRWKGTARQGDGGDLSIGVEYNFPYWQSTGPCPQNYSMAIGGVVAHRELPLAIAMRGCNDPETCPWYAVGSLELPLGDEPAGIVCRYLDESHTNAVQPGQLADVLGTLHRPPNEGQCDTGLVPLEIDADLYSAICAPSCSETAPECPLAELLSCQQSVCKLAETW